jgi:hypothetical protein
VTQVRSPKATLTFKFDADPPGGGAKVETAEHAGSDDEGPRGWRPPRSRAATLLGSTPLPVPACARVALGRALVLR